jgi:branched-chain amino acid transport system ATP-binding protein
LINSIVGVTRRFAGTIHLDGKDLTRFRPDQRAHAGIGWVPQERNIFKSLTVEENLTAVARPGPWTLEKIYRLFPRLQERKRNLGSRLSGGEQQMLAIGRALVLNPRILLLDEPLEGLAPILVQELLAALRNIIRGEGVSAILVEQNARKVLSVTDRAAILDRGSIVFEDSSEALRGSPQLLDAYLGVTERRSRRPTCPSRH